MRAATLIVLCRTKGQLPEDTLPWNVRRFGNERMPEELAARPQMPTYPHKLPGKMGAATFELAQTVTQQPQESAEATATMVTGRLTQLMNVKWEDDQCAT